MNELILKNVSKSYIDNNYIIMGTIEEYLKLVEEDFVEKYKYDPLKAREAANLYNENKDIQTITGLIINLLIPNNGINKAEFSGEDKDGVLLTKCDKIKILDGKFRTEIMKFLDKRFMNSKIMIRIFFITDKEAQNLLMN